MSFRITSGEARTVDHKEEDDWHELVTKSIAKIIRSETFLMLMKLIRFLEFFRMRFCLLK